MNETARTRARADFLRGFKDDVVAEKESVRRKEASRRRSPGGGDECPGRAVFRMDFRHWVCFRRVFHSATDRALESESC